jgi:hypothetical protein
MWGSVEFKRVLWEKRKTDFVDLTLRNKAKKEKEYEVISYP